MARSPTGFSTFKLNASKLSYSPELSPVSGHSFQSLRNSDIKKTTRTVLAASRNPRKPHDFF